jgi:predicted metal-dependent hydrolase
MGQAVLPGNPPVEITLRRSKRARRVSLRVSALDGRVTLSLPKSMPAAEALAFAQEKSEWIRGHLAKRSSPVTPQIGGTLPFRGDDVPIAAGRVRNATLQDGVVVVPPAQDMVPARLRAFLRLNARLYLTAASDRYSAVVGRPYGKITLRDTRSRWGSCTASGDLMYSWRLIMAPPAVLDYVAAHEVAHLAELNHSPAYWSVVERICPDYMAPRRWLREHGQRLHRYRFDD